MAEASRNTKLPSGYDEEFVYEVDGDFECLICQLPLKEPVQTRCGHRFCNACLEEHLRRQEVQNQSYTCPADRRGLDREKDVFPDNATGRKVLSLVIKCPSDGCSWTGELRNKEAHLEACPFRIVFCTNENCLETMKRKDLEQHETSTCEWRIIECPFCKELHPKRDLQDHMESCNKFPLSCPKSCGDLIPREMVPNHVDNDCPLALVTCPYAHMGCRKKFKRKSKDLHLRSHVQEHLDFACAELDNTQIQLEETTTLLVLTRKQLRNNQERTRILEEKLEVLQKQMEKKANADKEGGNTGTIWKIKNWSEVLRQAKEAKKTRIESDPFYTGRHGYKLKVILIPAYDDDPSVGSHYIRPHIVVFIVLMEGEYDDMLPWPFRKKITFTVIDQNEDLKERHNVTSYLSPYIYTERPRENLTPESSISYLISHETLQTRRYIVNDTLFLQVDIDSAPAPFLVE